MQRKPSSKRAHGKPTCLQLMMVPCWTTYPTNNYSGLCSIRAMTMAASMPVDSVWTQKTKRLCCVFLLCQLVVALPLVILLLRHPLVILSRRLVAALPLEAPPSCRLAVLSCHPLIVSLRQLVVTTSLVVLSFCRPLVLSSCWLVVALPLFVPPSSPLVVPAIFALPLPCHCLAIVHRQRHRTPLPLPPLNAISIVHHCHSCCPLPPSNVNAHLRPSPPSNTDARHRHPPPLVSTSIFTSHTYP